jgi:DNA mismatch repair protein MutL
MGFRGEALASIASVSQMVLKTKRLKENVGTEIICSGGEIKTIQDCGMKDGTVVEVNNLFFNTPARSKYLKQDSTELTHIIALLNTIALANSGVSFRLVHNGKIGFDLPKTATASAGQVDLLRRISDIFGQATADAMVPIFYGGSDFKVSGFVGKPVISRSDTRHQYIFVNKRPIQHHLIAYKIKEAMHSMLMEGKKPVFIINIEIDPSLVDVNVHPRKLEIRFEDESKILKTIYSAAKMSIENHDLTPKAFVEAKRYMSDRMPSYGKEPSGTVDEALEFTKNFTEPRIQGDIVFDDKKRFSLKAITQISNAYIVAENEAGLVLVDQHAAHERVRYFELIDQLNSQKKKTQPLLMPEDLPLAADEIETLKANIKIFEELGFEIEEGPGNTLVLYAVPAMLSSEEISDVINGVLDDINKEKLPTNLKGRQETVIHYMACRSAIKFGKKLSIDEMDALLNQMEKIDRPYTCPHGRPTMIKLTFDELNRMFGRK